MIGDDSQDMIGDDGWTGLRGGDLKRKLIHMLNMLNMLNMNDEL